MLVERTLMLGTALVPEVGYDKALHTIYLKVMPYHFLIA